MDLRVQVDPSVQDFDVMGIDELVHTPSVCLSHAWGSETGRLWGCPQDICEARSGRFLVNAPKLGKGRKV